MDSSAKIGTLNNEEKELLNILQKGFPIVERPFGAIGKVLGMPEDWIIEVTTSLQESGHLRYIGPIINPKRVGFKSTLVAMRIDKEKLGQAVLIINSHPGVSHNYLRDGRFNLWFTITTPSGIDLISMLKFICNFAGAQDYLILPSLKTYKIRVMLPVSTAENKSEAEAVLSGVKSKNGVPQIDKGLNHADTEEPFDLNTRQIFILKALEKGIKPVPEPFDEIARMKNLPTKLILEEIMFLLDAGVIRRFGGIPNHRKIGYQYNVMAVWKVDNKNIDNVGSDLANFPQISHCYQRITYKNWPYNLYTMIHAKSKKEASALIESIIDKYPIDEHAMLPSLKEYKKSRIRYFTSLHYTWQDSIKINKNC